MTLNKKKTWIIAVALAVVAVITIAALISGKAKAYSEDYARNLAEENLPAEARMTGMEQDQEEYEFLYVDETAGQRYEIEISKTSGQIVKLEQKTISSDKARSIVLAKIPGAAIVELEKDRDDGRVIYEGEAHLNGREYEFEIDAYTGTILKWETD